MGKSDSLLNVPWFFDGARRVLDGGQVPNLRLFLARTEYDSILDIGCGIGSFSRMTERRYLGVDIMPEYIEYARRKFGSPLRQFMVGDALDLDAERIGQFDVVSFINIIHHLADDEVRRLFERLKAVRPRSYFVVDMAREKGHLITELFRRLDRGAYFRSRDAQSALLESCGCWVQWQDVYWSTSRIYPHSVMLATVPGEGSAVRSATRWSREPART